MHQDTVGFELSSQQKFLFDLSPDLATQNARLIISLTGPLNIVHLENAVARVVARHEILRTIYRRSPGMRYPVQVVLETSKIIWEQGNFSEAHLQARDVDLAQICVHACLLKRSADEHLLIVRAPVLSVDRKSLQNFAFELSQAYASAPAGSPEPIQYVDYAQLQADLLSGTEPEDVAGRDYWTRHDGASLAELKPPFSRTTEAETRFSPSLLKVPIDLGDLAHLISQEGDDVSRVLAAWQTLLWRLTRVTRFALSFANDERSNDEYSNALGQFARVRPFIADLDPHQSFQDLASLVDRTLSEGKKQEDYFPPQRTPAIGFSHTRSFAPVQAAGVRFAIVDEKAFQPPLNLELRYTHGAEGASLDLTYKELSFWRDGAERIAAAFSVLLRAAFKSPETPIGSLPIIREVEWRRIHREFNTTAADYSTAKCIHDLFEEQVALSPDRIALRCGEQALSFAELNRRANQVAHFLQRRGIGPDSPVGLCTNRSVEMIVGLLAILKAGGCYVPLSHDQPKARLAYQLEETKARVTLTQAEFAPLLTDAGCEMVPLDGTDRSFLTEPVTNPKSTAQPANLAYVIYTSGSTGMPKGVAVEHSSLVNYSEFICRTVGAVAAGPLSFATVSTIAADLGNTCIFPSLISGGCLHVIPYEIAMSSALFSEYSNKHPIDVLKITPSHLKNLMPTSEAKGFWPRRYLFLGGEPLTWELLTRIRGAATCAVINHYGPTEATVGCCTFAVDAEFVQEWQPATVPIGRPVANTEVYILDDLLQPLPAGTPGELCVGGSGLAREYLSQPGQTRDKFISNPFSAESEARLYRTGDLARFLPDGNIEFLSRIDHQVKIRGFRVECTEVQAALQKHPQVAEAVVLPYDQAGEMRLAAYFDGASGLGHAELRTFLAHSLPEYMIPSDFVRVESMPLNRNGKINIHALLKLPIEALPGASLQTAPRSNEEVRLAAIWSEVLKRPCTDVHANFFVLGGHSLLAAQIVARIQTEFKVQLPLFTFLQTPTIAGLIPKIEALPRLREDDDLERLLATLENLSEEEAAQLLAEFDKGPA